MVSKGDGSGRIVLEDTRPPPQAARLDGRNAEDRDDGDHERGMTEPAEWASGIMRS
jgi:hypothetical protein